MTHRSRLAAVSLIGLALAATGLIVRAESSPLVLKGFSHHADGADRIFDVDIQNTSQSDVAVHGRLVAISVYDASPAYVMGLPSASIKPGETKRFETMWPGAPLVGRIRTLLVMSAAGVPTLVESSDFWALPIREAVVFIVAMLILAVVALSIMRLPRYLRDRIPANMIAYVAEPGDTVVSIAVRYGLTWQAVVKANRLKPPYEIKPGRRIFLPKHALQRPKESSPTQPQP